MMPTYHGSCHCGSVRFTIQADLSKLTRCTCSMCSKVGLLGCYVAEEQFRLVQGESDLSLYQFNKKIAKHFFCRLCGIHAFRRPRSNPSGYAVNVRCLDDFGLDTASYEVNTFDGRNWDAAQEARLNAARRTP
jgi:hypothetical protein